jgi:hypothetical protein
MRGYRTGRMLEKDPRRATLFGTLETFLARRRKRELERLAREYAAMTAEERAEIEAIRRSGGAGVREALVEEAANRSEDAHEGRPPAELEPRRVASGR